MPHEAVGQVFLDLSRDATDQVVVVQEPLGPRLRRRVLRRDRGEVSLRSLEQAGDLLRLLDVQDEPRRALDVSLGFG